MSLQVEMAVRKIVPVSEDCVILFSGAVSDGEEVIQRTKTKMNGRTCSPGEISVLAAQSYQEVKQARVEATILRPMLGVDYAGFANVVSSSATSQILQQILAMLMQHNLQLELLVAGVDDAQAHLFAVVNPGQAMGFDTVGCSAIGSGGVHANVRLALGRHGVDVSLSETIYAVYQAKTAAEAAPGVGKMSDVAIVRRGSTRFLTSQELSRMDQLRSAMPAVASADIAVINDLLTEPENAAST